MSTPLQAIVSLGSNIAEGSQKIEAALVWLNEFMTDVSDSGIYTTEAVNGEGSYFNMVVKGYTTLTVEEFELKAKEKERKEGRRHDSNSVVLDIDLISLGTTVVRPAELCRLYFLQGFEIICS